MKDSFITLAKDYASGHQKSLTQILHYVAVPCLFFALMIFFGFIKIIIPGVLETTLAWLLILLLLGFYMMLEWRLALCLLPLLFILNFFAGFLSDEGPSSGGSWVFFICLIVGIGAQLAASYQDKNRIDIFDDLKQVYIAPLYFIAELFFRFGKLQDLQSAICPSTPKKAK